MVLRDEVALDKDGIVLLDLLIVAIILGILAVVALPLLSSFLNDNKLNSSATEVVSGLQYAGNLAVRYQRPFDFETDLGANSFRVRDTADPAPNDPPVDANRVVLNPHDKSWFSKDFDAIEAYQGVKLLSGSTVRFYPDGHSGTSDSTFTVSLGDRQKSIKVDGMTGRVTVQ